MINFFRRLRGWNRSKTVVDNRERRLLSAQGKPLALEYRGAPLSNGVFNTKNHETRTHNDVPHHDPVVSRNNNLVAAIVYNGRQELRRYSLHVSDDGRSADVAEVKAWLAEENTLLSKFSGRQIYLVEMSDRDCTIDDQQEDLLQRGRGVRRRDLLRDDYRTGTWRDRAGNSRRDRERGE